MYVDDVYGKDKSGKYISIKTACYRAVDRELLHFRRKIAHNRQIDLCHNKKDIPDPRNCFEDNTTNYDKADAILSAMHLSEIELQLLDCYYNGMRRGEVMETLHLGRGSICYYKNQIRKKCTRFLSTV